MTDGEGSRELQPDSAGDRRAGAVAVREARLTLFWSLTVYPPDVVNDADGIAEIVKRRADELSRQEKTPWLCTNDPAEHIGRPKNGVGQVGWQNDVYAEALYFHEFVQSFLYRRYDGEERTEAPFFLFRRDDVAGAKVSIDGASRQLTVERLNLYLFRTGCAILVLEVATPLEGGVSGWTLGEFQSFHDCFRRLYAPFAGLDQGLRTACHLIPRSVAWLGADGEALADGPEQRAEWSASASLGDVEPFVETPGKDGRRVPPIFAHWRFLMADALPLPPGDPGMPVWRPISDERLPTMATVSLTPVENGEAVSDGDEAGKKRCAQALEAVHKGDLMRLCFADGAGPAPFPYDPAFLERSWSDHVYDRFRSMGSLYLFSGYAFVAVGVGDYFDRIATAHLRRHYFQMGLLLHFEEASLLAFSSQISRAVERLGAKKHREKFADAMSGIEQQFLHFTHRFRFTGVTNQLQGREMFDQWRKRLRLEELFKDVREELHTANEFLASEEQTEQTLAAVRLSQVATIGVVLALAVGALGMNVVFKDGPPSLDKGELHRHLGVMFGAIGICALLGIGVVGLLQVLTRMPWKRVKDSVVAIILAGIAVIGGLGYLLFHG